MPDLPTIHTGAPISIGTPLSAQPPAYDQPQQHAPLVAGGVGAFLRRQYRLIFVCAALGAGAAAFFSWRMEPVYRARASVRIDSRPTQLPALNAMGLAAPNPLLTEIELLRSQSLAERVADSLGLEASFVRAGTAVKRRNPDADIVDVSFRAGSPELARDVANALAREFIDRRHDSRREEAEGTAAFLREQAKRVAAQLASAESELRAFREREGVVNLQAEASSGVMRHAELEAQRNSIDAERVALQSLLDRVRRDSRGGIAPSTYRELLAFPTLLRSPASGLLTPLIGAEDRLNDLLTRRTREDPDVQAAEARIAQLQGQIQSTVRNYLDGLNSQVQALNGVLGRSETRLAEVPAREIRYAQLDRDAKGTEAIFSMLQQRLHETEIAVASTDQTIRLIDAATLPGSPEQPKPLLYTLLGTLAGAMLGLSGALFRDRADKSVRTRREVLSATSLPVLGLIPHVGRMRGWALGEHEDQPERPLQLRITKSTPTPQLSGREGGTKITRTAKPASRLMQPETAFREDEMMAFREAYIWLATNLRLTLGKNPLKSILITSALPAEGKTTVAINLAMCLAQDGQRVLLIDGDLRAGRIGASLDIRNVRGLSDVLAGKVDFDRAVVGFEIEGERTLSVIPAGGPTARPTQLLSSRLYGELLEWAKASYDAIVIDATPVNAVADAGILARHADGVLFVARSGVSEYPAIAFAMEQLRSTGAPVLGAVLNDADLRHDPEFGQAYEYYGRYKAATAGV